VGYERDGAKPEPLLLLYYLRSDMVDVNGNAYMKAFKLRRTGRSTRIYCTKCYSVLGVDHPTYPNSVFLSLPDHCANHCDLSLPLSAYLNMIDYSTEWGPLSTEDVPLLVTTRFPQERKRLLSLSDMADIFRTLTERLRGLTLAFLIQSLGEVTILNLAKGEPV
jgi:hypothetical protein